jgi:hypothetical protein
VKDLQESVDVSLIRYRGGTANYLDSQRWSFQAELTLAQARNNEYQSLVQLYSPEYIVNEPWIGYRSRCLNDQEPAAVQKPMSNDDKPIGVATALTIGSFALIGVQ